MKDKSKNALKLVVLTLLFALGLAGCGGNQTDGEINLVSREDGSGTRGAFAELTGIEDDNFGDLTYKQAVIQNSTNGVMSIVANDPRALAYASLGSVNESVKVIKVDGVYPSSETIKSGDYPIARPFNIVYYEDGLDEVQSAFVDYIFSKEGQEVVEEASYIAVVDNPESYSGPTGLVGQFTVGGSTSVAPVVNKIIESFNEVNPGVQIDVQETGSGAGITGALEGTLAIGLSSRDLDENEARQILSKTIALDGITVIVSNENPVENISLDDLTRVFMGEIRNWEGI